jgi:NAD(P)-dependent dehydrogenase (short-subunit alcohol dehydrogenase family)
MVALIHVRTTWAAFPSVDDDGMVRLQPREAGDAMGQRDGKAGIITGAASGIGAACARVLAREGTRLVLTDVDQAAGERVAGETGSTFIRHDVTDEASWPAVVAVAMQKFGGLHILVANAGIGIMGPAIGMSLADWRRQISVNVDGVFLSVKYCIPAMRRSGGGSIIMMSSVAGLHGSVGLAGYSASKGAVRLFAKSIALECAQARDGIRVNSVHPGIIDTLIWTKLGMVFKIPLTGPTKNNRIKT